MLNDSSLRAASADGVLSELNLKAYLEVAGRRKWWVLITAIALSIPTVVVVLRLPNFYRANTVIMLDPGQVPSNYVSSPVTTSIQDRLSTIQQQVMSPSRLTKVIDTLGLYPELRGNASTEAIITKMQKATTIEVANAGDRRLSSFRIAFQASDPNTAARVANELANQFIAENLKAREQQFAGTTDFLNAELEDTKKQLEQKEAELGRIKSAYIMDLPESKQFHLEALATLRSQLRASQDRVAYDQQQRLLLQSMAATSAPAVDADPDAASGSPNKRQIEKLQTQLSDLRAHYGPSYPDVRKIQSEIKQLEIRDKQDDQAGAAIPANPAQAQRISNPVIESQIQKLDDEIAQEQGRQPQLQEQIDFHSSKLEREPVFEQQISGLMRDYDALRTHYNALLEKKLSAEMATELESRQEGERFEILDAATASRTPAGPNRPLLMLAGIIVSVFAGLGLAFVVELTDESVRNERDVATIFGVGVLVGIPLLQTKREISARRVRAVGALAATVLVATGIGWWASHVVAKFF